MNKDQWKLKSSQMNAASDAVPTATVADISAADED